MKEFFSLAALRAKVTFFAIIEQIRVTGFYVEYPTFALYDIKLLLSYLFHNPFGISKNFHEKRGSDEVHVYGETPLTSLATILKEAAVQESDTFFDLGMGRGRGCFFVRDVIGCKVVGIEFIQEFVQKAQAVQQRFKISDLEFRQEDITQSNFAGGTVFYIYSNFLPDSDLTQVAAHMANLPAGIKVISVSFPITDYSDQFEVSNCFPIAFPWGWTDVYISTRI